MIEFNVKSNVKGIERKLSRLQRKQLPFATMNALNDTAFEVFKEVKDFIPKAFSSPTPWTRKSIKYDKAKKTKLTAIVRLGRFAGKGISGETIFTPHVKGGTRDKKRTEKRLGTYLMPGKSIRRNKYGNIPASKYSKALSDMGRGMVGIKTSGKKAKYFYANIRGTTAIWERYGKGKIRPFLVSTRAPRYRRRFPFEKLTKIKSQIRFPINFRKRLRQALATAR